MTIQDPEFSDALFIAGRLHWTEVIPVAQNAVLRVHPKAIAPVMDSKVKVEITTGEEYHQANLPDGWPRVFSRKIDALANGRIQEILIERGLYDLK